MKIHSPKKKISTNKLFSPLHLSYSRLSSRMLKSATSFLVLSLVALQVVIAKVIESGTYLIQDTDSGLYLGLDPVPATYPPRDVPVRLFPKGHYFVEKWNVKKTHDGTLTIFAGHGSPQNYKIVSKGDYVFVSAQKAPEAWAVESAGKDNVQIKLPYQDRVFTTTHDIYSPITLQPAQGLPNQRYKFIRIDREHYRNRFYNQKSW